MALPRPPAGRRLPHLLLALALGIAGGMVFAHFRLPLPWMLGPMSFCALAAVLGAPLRGPVKVRPPMQAVIGVMLGSGFTPEVLARVGEWWLSLSLLMGYLLAVGLAAYPYFRRFAGYDPTTAYFSAMPGGFSTMLIAGSLVGGDERQIVLAHACRILLVVFAMPFLFQLVAGIEAIDRGAAGVHLTSMAPGDIAVLVACGAVGWPLAKALRVPAAILVGPTLVSAAVHLTAFSSSAPPVEIVNLAQYVIGTVAGCRFVGVALREVVRGLGHGLAITVIMLGLTVLFATVIGRFSEVDMAAVILAYSPGGLAEMTLIALALGIDIAFVATHHIIRIMLITVGAPLVFRLLGIQSKTGA